MASMAGKAPGVYVQEVPAADKPIAGVGTSTAGFIGVFSESITGEAIGTADGTNKEFMLRSYPVVTDAGSFAIKVGDAAQSSGVTLTNDDTRKRAKVVFAQAPTAGAITADYKIALSADPTVAAKPGEVKLCTNFTEFTKYFGDFSSLAGQSMLAHAVYGFFNNGGTRCFVVRDISTATIDALLTKFAAIDEIAIVAAPGIAEKSVRTSIYNHCQNLEDRFAIFDTGKDDLLTDIVKTSSTIAPDRTTYAALYFPWLLEFDPLAKAANPAGDGSIPVPPSGHIAGPNDPDLKYINVRRLLIFLRESIEQGTQWVVFEPNSPALWQKIKRNITAFLTNVWRDGALFGDTAQQAFYVKCDAETNPPELRDIGQVVTEIGVAIVRPAEFVIFRISQWSGPPA
jgi:phage tail sheath protein FI